MAGPLPTPDFYDHPWRPLAAAAVDHPFVELSWPDGVELRAHAWWLRENIVADGATDPLTREGTVDPATLPDDLVVATAAVTDDGALALAFRPDGFRGALHPGWLHHVAEGRHRTDHGLPEPESWTAATLPTPETFTGPEVLADDAALRAWLTALVRHGVARLVDVPRTLDAVGEVAGRVGAIRDTNFGAVWSVKAEIAGDDENSTANTALRLGPHTDLPTREVPPGFQLLHCVENTCTEGWGRLTDGRALVEHLARAEPEVHEALTTLDWIFFNRSRDHDHRWTGPIIEGGGPGRPLTIRAFYPVRAFPDMPDTDLDRAHRAVRRFHEIAADPRFQISSPFRPGDLVAFDNRRVLHGRDAFAAGRCRRHLRGCYLDHDEVHSRLRVLTRHHESSDPDTQPPRPAP